MTRILRADTPLPIRLLIAAASLTLGLTAWTAAWLRATAGGGLVAPTALAGLAALCVGFLGLGVAHAARAPLLASQMNSVIVLVLALLLFAGFPRFPFVALFALMVMTAIASLLAFRGPAPLAFAIVMTQGALGLYLGWAVVHLATAFPLSEQTRVPLALWATLSVASLTAVWHARLIRVPRTTSVMRGL